MLVKCNTVLNNIKFSNKQFKTVPEKLINPLIEYIIMAARAAWTEKKEMRKRDSSGNIREREQG